MSPRLSDLFLRSQSDERLVNLACAGNERAFTAIVERYRPELAALARRLSSDATAEDILQQAFLSALVALRSGAEVRHLRGWLYQIVRNTAVRDRAPRYAPLGADTATTESLEDVVETRARAHSALSNVARLPDRQRQAIIGTALGGRPRAEVANSMGLSEGAVRQLLHRARSSLRSAVTAVTPWPLARWLATAGQISPGPADMALGAGAASSGAAAIKLGLVLVSGSLAAGIAAVDIHGAKPRPLRVHEPATSRLPGVDHAAVAVTRVERPRSITVAGGASVAPSRGVALAGSFRNAPGVAATRPTVNARPAVHTSGAEPTVASALTVWRVGPPGTRRPPGGGFSRGVSHGGAASGGVLAGGNGAPASTGTVVTEGDGGSDGASSAPASAGSTPSASREPGPAPEDQSRDHTPHSGSPDSQQHPDSPARGDPASESSRSAGGDTHPGAEHTNGSADSGGGAGAGRGPASRS